MQVGHGGQLLQHGHGLWLQRGNNRRASSCGSQSMNQCGKCLFVFEQYTSVQRENEVIPVFNGKFVEPCGTHIAQPIRTNVVRKQVAHHIYFRQSRALTIGDGVVAHSSRKEYIGKAIYHDTVHLFRHIDVEAACACRQMGQRDALLFGYNGNRHGRCQIVDNNHGIGRMGVEILVKTEHHLCCNLVQVVAVYTQIGIRMLDSQFLEKTVFKGGIVILARIYQRHLYVRFFRST